jgi:hypothetical protein
MSGQATNALPSFSGDTVLGDGPADQGIGASLLRVALGVAFMVA